MGRYLGLDSSTQGLTGFVVDTKAGELVLQEVVNFTADLPQFKCAQGVLAHPNPLVKHSDPLMWVAALELLLTRARDHGFDWGTVEGISGSGQQHGSVYLNQQFLELKLETTAPLAEQLKPCLSRATSPIWMDSSTTEECREIARAAGGDETVVKVTGSRAIERFTGPQIRKFYKEAPDAYAATARIHLVSSFMASLLVGGDAPIDFGDGAGMNLLSLAGGKWSPELLEATAPGLAEKLPAPAASSTKAGVIARYFVEKYGFRKGVPVIAWSGDNPCSLVGMGAIRPGTAVISLGTSDTCFAAMSQPKTDPRGFGHVFGNPAGGFMCLICFKNGSLAREEVAKHFNLDWDAFSKAILAQTQPGNDGRLMLPYFVPEITPVILEPAVLMFGDDAFCKWEDAAGAARAIIEAQAVSMKLHSAWIGEKPKSILVTGGASRNLGVLQVLADVFQANLQRLTVTNSAALGAALRAANAVGKDSWGSLFGVFSAPDPGCKVTPNAAAAKVYTELGKQFQAKLSESLR